MSSAICKSFEHFVVLLNIYRIVYLLFQHILCFPEAFSSAGNFLRISYYELIYKTLNRVFAFGLLVEGLLFQARKVFRFD